MAQGSFSKKEAAISFLRLVVARKIREAYATYAAKDMRHHNPWFAGDAASLEKGMEENHAKFPNTTIDIKRALETETLWRCTRTCACKPANREWQ